MVKLLVRAVAIGAVLLTLGGAKAWAGFDEAVSAYQRGDYATALKELRPLAEQGHIAAQLRLGEMYQDGKGVPQDYAEALRWYRKAADQGDSDAQLRLGKLYHYGKFRVVPQDYAEAIRWYRKAADQGDSDAQLRLGKLYQDGKGVPQDYAEALRRYRKAADQGNSDAQLRLGELYQDGKGVPQAYAEAIRWYRKAVDQGNGTARHNLGEMYQDGKGVPQDYAEALRWYRKAADSSEVVGALQRTLFLSGRQQSYDAIVVGAEVERLLGRLERGSFVFNLPVRMTVGEQLRVRALLQPGPDIEALQNLIRRYDYERVQMFGSSEDVRVANVMQARLWTGDAFKVDPSGYVESAVSRREPTQWQWWVTAKKSGTQGLDIRLNAKIFLDGAERPMNLLWISRKVEVVAVPQSLLEKLNGLLEPWQKLVGGLAVIVGALGGIYRLWQRRRKKLSRDVG